MTVQRPSKKSGEFNRTTHRDKTGGAGRLTAIALGITFLAACVKPAPEPVVVAPPPPPPPPPPVELIPYRPLPPNGAAYVMNIPEKDAFGQRQTINSNLTDDEKVWHFRVGWNAAALNCTAPQYAPINKAYNTFINTHQKALVRVNSRLETQFQRSEGSKRAALLAREEKLTSTYNFFSLPPARRNFCIAMLELSNQSLLVPPTDPVAYALANFDYIQQPFNLFFDEYEVYERESAQWDMKYGADYGESQAGWVAVQEARAAGNPNVPTVGDDALASTLSDPATVTSLVEDPESGVKLPVVPVDEGVVSQPVVQPIKNDEPDDEGEVSR